MSQANFYAHPIITATRKMYGDALRRYYLSISERLAILAGILFRELNFHSEAALTEVSNYHPEYLGTATDKLITIPWTLQDARQTIASEHGFLTWHQVGMVVPTSYNVHFEEFVDAIIEGRYRDVKKMLSVRPELTSMRSPYGHKATALHYLGSNGVELYRQIVPDNAAQMASLLIAHGADPALTMEVYGGKFTVCQLVMTSAHPAEAGLKDELARILCQEKITP